MSNRTEIGKLRVIVDTDKSYEKIGEVEFSLDEKAIKQHIRKYGHQELCEQLAFLQYQVWNALREVNGEDDSNAIANPDHKDLTKLN